MRAVHETDNSARATGGKDQRRGMPQACDQSISPASGKRKPRALLFCRPYLVPDFRACFEPLSNEYDLVVLTDGRRKGEHDTRMAFYRLLAVGAPRLVELSDAEEDDCIQRCRLLRNLPRRDAENRLRAMATTLHERFNELKPDIVASHLADDYVTHLVCILSRKHNLPYFAYCASFFPRYAQLFCHENGTPVICRDPDDEEVERTIAAISRSKFRQHYYSNPKAYSPLTHVYRVARYGVKRLVFYMKGVLERDPLHTHYAIVPYLAERRRLSDYPPARLFTANWRDRAAQAAKPLLYFVLSYFPESTNDYWVENKSMLQYDDTVENILRILSRDFTILVKEHPHMMGMRNSTFYRRLQALPNIILVPPLEFSSEVMAQCRAVIIGAGSGGVEAVLRGLPVFTYSNTSYWFEPSGAQFLDLDHLETWPVTIMAGLNEYCPLSDEAKRKFVKACLATTVSLRDGGKIWPLTDERQTKFVVERMLQ